MRPRLRSQPGRAIIAMTAGIILVGGAPARQWRTSSAAAAQVASVALANLQNAPEFRAQFNADRGKTRLVLLLSPT